MEIPKTMDDATNRVIEMISEIQLSDLKSTQFDDLIGLHHMLGRWIRNEFGLWNADSPLLREIGTSCADEASGRIIEAVWKLIQEDPSVERSVPFGEDPIWLRKRKEFNLALDRLETERLQSPRRG